MGTLALFYEKHLQGRVKLLLITIYLSLLAPQARAETLPHSHFITHIEVVSSQALLLSEEEKKIIQSKSNIQPFTAIQVPLTSNSLVNQAVRGLAQIGYHVAIKKKKLDGEKIDLYIEVYEKLPVLETITWQGISTKEERQLLTKIKPKKGDICHMHDAKQMAEAIKKHMHALGYARAQVTHLLSIDRQGKGHIHLIIKKGSIYHTGQLVFQGAKKYESDSLSKKIPLYGQSRESLKRFFFTIWISLKKRKWREVLYACYTHLRWEQHFTYSLVEESVQILLRFYQSEGFLDARIVPQITFEKKTKEAHITFHIQKGKQYKIRNIRWVSNGSHQATQVEEKLAIRPGTVYRPFKMHKKLHGPKQIEEIQPLYQTREMMLIGQNLTIKGVENKWVDIEISLQEIQRPTIRHIKVEKGGVEARIVKSILASYRIAKGQKLYKMDLIRAQHEMTSSHLVDGEKIKLVPVQVGANQIDLRCVVPMGYRVMNTSFSLDVRKGIDASIGVQNLDLWKLCRLEAPTQGTHALTVKWPYLWGNEGKEKTSIRKIEFENPFLLRHGKRYTLRSSYGQYLTSEKDQSNEFLVGLRRYDHYKKVPFRKTIDLAYSYGNQSEKLFKRIRCRIELERRDINHWFYPTSGTGLQVRKDTLLLFEEKGFDFDFRLIGSYTRYRQFGPFVLMQKASIGYPSVASCTNELRYKYSSTSYALFFCNIGIGNHAPLDSDTPRFSLGISVRHMLPLLGILSLDLSYNWKGNFDVDMNLKKMTSF